MAGKGDIVEQALKLVMGGGGDDAAKAGIRAYHGSPHDFDRFDMSKIGTGEGAQAYGHGLYFASNEAIAKSYRDDLSRYKWDIDGPHELSDDLASKGIDPRVIQTARTTLDQVRNDVEEALHSLDKTAQYTGSEIARQSADLIRSLRPSSMPPGGRMYEVEINADPDAFLDWDKPLSEQPEAVRRALEASDVFKSQGYRNPNDPSLKGSTLYDDFGIELGNPKNASQKLREAGIPGIKYLDAGSRSAGDGTRNYVVFDDKLISIIRKYGIAGASAMLGYNLMEQLDPKQPFPLRGRFAKYDPENIHEPDLMKAFGGEVNDDDIDDAIRIAKDVGGGTSASHLADPTLERAGMIDEGEPVNYETEVKPFIDIATFPMNYAVEDPSGYSGLPVSTGTVQTDGLSLLDTMKIASQLAASGQPTDDRGEYNWGRMREGAVRRLVGAPEGGEEAPYRGPFSYNPSETANYLNTIAGFSPIGWAELFHDTPYEAGRTGDYGTAAYEGGLNALLSAPGIAALGLAGRAALNAIRKNPKLAAAGAAAATGAGSYFLPDSAEADPNVNKALSLTSGY